MSTKQKIINAYFVIGLLFALYEWKFGMYSYKGFFYNLGKGLIWPAVLFPSLGHIIGGVIILLFVVFVVVFVR